MVELTSCQAHWHLDHPALARTGDYVLPTGQALPFGLTLKRLKRHRLLATICAGGPARDSIARQWEHAMVDRHAVVRFCA